MIAKNYITLPERRPQRHGAAIHRNGVGPVALLGADHAQGDLDVIAIRVSDQNLLEHFHRFFGLLLRRPNLSKADLGRDQPRI